MYVIVEGLVYGDDGGGNVDTLPQIVSLSPQEFVDLLFLTALQRRATTVEMTDLIDFLDNDVDHLTTINNRLVVRDNRHDEIAMEIMDYISRLPEFYYFTAVN